MFGISNIKSAKELKKEATAQLTSHIFGTTRLAGCVL
jgi:hypothetical protein